MRRVRLHISSSCIASLLLLLCGTASSEVAAVGERCTRIAQWQGNAETEYYSADCEAGRVLLIEQDRDTESRDLVLHDVATGQRTRVSESGSVARARVSGDVVVWQDYRDWEVGGDNIYMTNLVTLEESAVCMHPAQQSAPAVSGEWIVWEDARNSETTHIHAYHLSSGVERQIPGSAGGRRPRIDGERVVWATESSILVHDLASSVTRPLTQGGGPDVSGSRVAFVRDGNIHVIDLDTLEERQLTSSSALDDDCEIAGDIVAFERLSTRLQIWLFDLSTGEESLLMPAPNGDQHLPRVSLGGVSWDQYDDDGASVWFCDLARAQPDEDGSVISIAGGSRYETAVLASKEAFPDGADTVVIATGRNWPDALGGSALAGALDAPILLVATDSVPEVVLGEIGRLEATKAVIIGGEAAVGAEVATALQAAGLAVERVWGTDRYLTADAVARRVITELGADYDGTAFVATGGAYADAVAAGPLAAAKGWPLFLAHPTGGLREATLSAMTGVTDTLVLGGPAAVSEDTYATLTSRLGDANVTRLAGESRYGTAAVVAEYGVANAGLGWDRVGIATGQAYPDALAGGVLQGKVGSVMLLTRTASLPDETAQALTANKADISTVTYFGGELAVSAHVRVEVGQVLE